MKVITILFSITSLSSFAGIGDSAGGGSKMSWNEIKASYHHHPQAPQVRMDGVHISLINTCYVSATDQLRTLDKRRVYERMSRGHEDIWVPMNKKYLYANRTFTKEFCTGGGEQCEWREELISYPLETEVDVLGDPSGDRSFGPLLFKKEFKVPKCEEN